jgi:hypothetical protein
MMAAFNINPTAAEHVSAAAPEPSIAPLCQCARALFGLAVTDIGVAVGEPAVVVGAAVWCVGNLWLRVR